MSALAHRKVLVLNKAWRAINVVTLEDALKKLCGTYKSGEPKARIIDCLHDFRTMTWDDWRELIPHSNACPECRRLLDKDQIDESGHCKQCQVPVGEEGIKAVNAILRIPTVIQLTRYDKMPAAKIHYNRRTIYRRDNNTCFIGDTLILMSDLTLKPISEIRVGDEVLDAYGNQQTVEHVHSRKAVSDEVVKIKHRGNGDPLVCTKDHKILGFAWNGDMVSGEEGVAAGNMTISSYLAEIVPVVPTDQPVQLDLMYDIGKTLTCDASKVRARGGHKINRFIPINRSLGDLCGYYLSEGSISGNTVVFTLHAEEVMYGEEIRSLLSKVFGVESSWETEENRGRVKCHSSIVAAFFSNFFGHGDDKRVGIKHDIDFLRGILYGVCRGDAAFNSDQARCTVQMSRPMLIRDLYIVSLMLGLCPSLSKTGVRKDGRIYKAINFNAADFNTVAKLAVVPYIEWQPSKSSKTDRNRVGNRLISKITEIKQVEYDGLVYDLQVSGSHTYIANFVSVHNCQYCGRRPGTKELSIDHVLPRAQGGKTTWENVVVACTECNAKKADRTPEQAGMKLLRQPKKPRYNLYPGDLRVKDWENFLGAAYWLTELEHDE